MKQLSAFRTCLHASGTQLRALIPPHRHFTLATRDCVMGMHIVTQAGVRR